ncbi:hypothetical protein D3C86_1431250 [compost metagenome]
MPGKHIGLQAVETGIGNIDRLFFRVIRNDRQHRAENLLSRNVHVTADVGKDRGSDKIALVQADRPALPAGNQRRALRLAAVDETLYAVELGPIDQGPDNGGGIARIADDHRCDQAFHAADDVFGVLARHQQTRAGDTRLTVVHERSIQCQGYGGVEIGVLKNNRGRLPRKRQAHSLHGLDTGASNELAGGGRPGE